MWIIVGDQEAQISWMECYNSKLAKLQKNLAAMELKQVWDDEDTEAKYCSTIRAATTGATINEISYVR